MISTEAQFRRPASAVLNAHGNVNEQEVLMNKTIK